MRRLSMVVAAAIAAQSCSFFSVQPPPSSGPTREYPHCTEQSAAALGDVAAALLFTLIAGAELDEGNDAAGAAYGAVAVGFWTSLVYAMRVMTRCKDARAKWQKVGPYRGFGAQDARAPDEPDAGVGPYRGFDVAPDAGAAPDAGLDAGP